MEIIHTNEAKCVGCDRCTRECPVEAANITYKDSSGDTKVRVDSDKCINCGRCLEACKHGARYYIDDTGRFLGHLKNDVPISVIVAPSIKTNIPHYRRLLAYLKSQSHVIIRKNFLTFAISYVILCLKKIQ